MVWGCFSWNGVGTLVLVDGIMNADKHINIINENLEKAILKMNLDKEFIFQQGNDPRVRCQKKYEIF